MIFVTVGHQMPFDRLMSVVDAWAERYGRADLFAQYGHGCYFPRHFPGAAFLTVEQYQERIARSTAIVAHAGTGTIIAALQLGKPLLVLPRRADLGETRNDHQIATARHFEATGNVLVAWSESELATKLNAVESFQPRATLNGSASPELIDRIRSFLRTAS